MPHRKMYISRPNKSPSFPLPSLPPNQWCDFRRDYESGATLKAIAARYMCDPRTVRRCIMHNKSSSELGRQTAPTKLAPYHSMIDNLYAQYIKEVRGTTGTPERIGICQISQIITQNLIDHGYTGSERTVRNYLRSKYQYIYNKNLQKQPTTNHTFQQ